MLVMRAQNLGSAGVVINAHLRDGNGILSLNFPAFAHGCHAYGLQRRHNVVDFRCSITIDKVGSKGFSKLLKVSRRELEPSSPHAK